MGCVRFLLCLGSRVGEKNDADTTFVEWIPGLERPLVPPALRQDTSRLSTETIRNGAGCSGTILHFSASSRSCEEESSMISAQSSHLSPEDDSTIENNPTWFHK
mmetsp:Transcript_13550/g.20655  ORF Transcript_13550/g.20655 Transcript_13550/m.20655 type:complete len:104 (-) Transcript_13550:785-1096(-)